MTLYAPSEGDAIMRFYDALASGKRVKIYEKYWAYKDLLLELRCGEPRQESMEKERKIDEEYRKAVK